MNGRKSIARAWLETRRAFSAIGRYLVLSAMVMLGVPAAGAGDSLRCGRRVVSRGDAASRVVRRCGEPSFKDHASEAVRLENGRKTVRVERWHYKPGARRLERIVLIYQGRVVGVETGRR